MNEKTKKTNPIAIIIVIIAVIAVAIMIFARKEEFKPVIAGSVAPDFTLPDLDGKEKSLKDFRGKVVFLNFWATWCKPCEEELPSMQTLYDALKTRPFEIIAISIDTADKETVRDFIKKYDITFTVLHNKKGGVKEAYKTTGVPETFIIDHNGVIREKVMGPRDWTRRDNLKTIFEVLQEAAKVESKD